MTFSIFATARANPHTTPLWPGSRFFGLLLIAEAGLSLVPVVVLGSAIGWPLSLTGPAAEQLAGIAAHPAAVAGGYAVYLAYSILIAPVMIGLAARTCGSLAHPLAATVAALGALSALARSVGIVRWLTVMPVLASAHAGADLALRTQLELVFTGLTLYGGGIGEVLGLSVLMAAALGLLCVGGRMHKSMPWWLAGLGLLCALALLGLSAPVLGVVQPVSVAAGVSLLSVWMLAIGVWIIQTRPDRA